MLSDEQIKNLLLYKMPAGELVNLDRKTGEVLAVIAKANSIDNDFINLFQSAPLIYQTLSFTLEFFDTVIANMKAQRQIVGLLQLETIRESVAKTLEVVQRGIDVVSKEITEKKNMN